MRLPLFCCCRRTFLSLLGVEHKKSKVTNSKTDDSESENHNGCLLSHDNDNQAFVTLSFVHSDEVVAKGGDLGHADLTQVEAIQNTFHELILSRNGGPTEKQHLSRNGFLFPSLIELASKEHMQEFYGVPGMCGGFETKLFKNVRTGVWRLECSSWCRVAEGSGRTHEITQQGGLVLLEQGFV
jgi:hypothetical protein